MVRILFTEIIQLSITLLRPCDEFSFIYGSTSGFTFVSKEKGDIRCDKILFENNQLNFRHFGIFLNMRSKIKDLTLISNKSRTFTVSELLIGQLHFY